jgi:hypothetical protein
LSFEYLIANKERINQVRWQFDELSSLLIQEYSHEKQMFQEKKCREHMAAYMIQQWWLRVSSDPRNPVCIRRLERGFNEYSSHS